MKSSVEQINPVQCRVNVAVSPEAVNKAFDNAFRRLQKKAHIQGFRPGKAPLNIIRKLYGERVSGEVGESLINEHLFGALNEQTIRPIASPVVEKADVPTHDQEFNFSAVIDIMPEISFDDYKGLAVNAETYTVKDETVEKEIEALQRRHAATKPLEGTDLIAAEGHVAVLSHTATVEGQDIPNMNVQNAAVPLGQQQLHPELESAIIGMKTGEVKTATIKLPETYADAAVAGKDVELTITLHELKQLDIPAFDDEFAKDLDYESAEKLKSNIRERLETRSKDLRRQKLENAILDLLLERHPFEVPPAMVDQVVDSMINELGQQHQQSKEQLQKLLHDPELRKECRPEAKRRTQNTLLLWHVVQKEKLEVSDEEVNSLIDQQLQSLSISDAKQIAKLKSAWAARTKENRIFEKAMDFLIENAVVTDVPADL